MFTLTLTSREATGKSAASALAKDGLIPAIIYGAKKKSESVSIPLADFKKILRDAGESTVIELDGLGGKMQALIQDVDFDPVTNLPRHADLLIIEKGAKMEVSVPLSFVGEAPAVKLGARLVKVMHELEVVADAAHLPHEIAVDVTVLENAGDQVRVADLSIPSGVEVRTDAEEVVALVQVAEEETEESAALDMGSIEVEKKGKEAEEGGQEA